MRLREGGTEQCRDGVLAELVVGRGISPRFEIEASIDRALFDEGQNLYDPTDVLLDRCIDDRTGRIQYPSRQVFVSKIVVMRCQADLNQIVHARNTSSGLAG